MAEGEISRTATVSWLTGPPRGLGRISVGSKAFARLLERNRLSARELTVDGTYTFAGEWFEIEAVSFRVKGRVDGAESNAFERTAREALERCAESHWLLAGEIELRAELL